MHPSRGCPSNSAIKAGSVDMYPVLVSESEPHWLDTVNDTVYVPVAYV